MSINMDLAKERGISDRDVDLINRYHNLLEAVIVIASEDDDAETRKSNFDFVCFYEFKLQSLWGFDLDARYHKWKDRLRARYRALDYAGVYRCTLTGKTRTIDAYEVTSPTLIGVGEGFIDFSGYNVRIVGPLERISN